MDAAIALSSAGLLDASTPLDDGYGAPNSLAAAAFIGPVVKKYGRTTGLTFGEVAEIDVTVNVCYVIVISCTKQARFVDQISVTPGSFSDGGDSGSLIVTQNGNNPVALLFAGSSTLTFGSPIDPILARFGVTVDDEGAPQPNNDVAITAVFAPNPLNQGAIADVDVAVENLGIQDAGPFDVTLTDITDGGIVGVQSVSSLPSGNSMTLTFSWDTTTASIGGHTLEGSHDHVDNTSSNDKDTTMVTVNSADGALITKIILRVRQGGSNAHARAGVFTDEGTTVTGRFFLSGTFGNEYSDVAGVRGFARLRSSAMRNVQSSDIFTIEIIGPASGILTCSVSIADRRNTCE